MSEVALRWMSYRGAGRTPDLTTEITGGLAAARLVDRLVTLGHVERTGTDGWRVAPPVLAGLPQNGIFRAVLCGARTPAVLESLESAGVAEGAEVIRTPQDSTLPDCVTVVAATPDALARVSAGSRIPLQRDAGFAMLACSPSIRHWPRTPCPMVQGKVESVSRFSRSRLRWVDSTIEEAASSKGGFFQIVRDWDRVSLIKSGRSQAALINVRAGRIACAAKCRVLEWIPASGTVAMPALLQPPAIIARALALCSGTVPAFDGATGRLSFSGLKPEHLRLFSALTRLRLQ